MTEIILRKRGASLIPVDDRSRELLAKLKDNRDVKVAITQPRNPQHHRKFFVLVDFVREHAVDRQGNSLFEHADEETIADAIKIATGYVKRYIDMNTGETWGRPMSINWASMDQTKFNKFYQNAVDVICQRWMPEGSVTEETRKRLIEIVDGEHAT